MKKLSETKRYLKEKLIRDNTTLFGYAEEQEMIKNLFLKTKGEKFGETALLIGGPKCGKTTLVKSVLTSLLADEEFRENSHIVCLDGFYHTDDRRALKTATEQLKLERFVEGKTFNSFSENLAFLLSCLYSGNDTTKRLIFIIEEFELFCAHHNQTLLYNLFDVAQSAQAPICVLGVTSRLDAIELLEKRVKSRFSHRQIFLFPRNDNFNEHLKLCETILSLPDDGNIANPPNIPDDIIYRREFSFLRRNFNPKKYSFDANWKNEWNSFIKNLIANKKVQRSLRCLYDFDSTIGTLKNFLYQIVSELNEDYTNTWPSKFESIVEKILTEDDKVLLTEGLSVLEVCILISIKHHCDIYDRDPFNFEIIFSRFSKFSLKSSTMKSIDREVALKAFEHLKLLEFITPVGTEGKAQKEYQLYRSHINSDQVLAGVKSSQNLPIEVSQWATSSFV